MARHRSRASRDLPPNLYEKRPGYFLWRNPLTGIDIPLDTNHRAIAINQAIEANNYIYGQSEARLLDRINGEAERTVANWCDEWLKSHPRARLQQLKRDLGDKVLVRLEPHEINTWLKQWDDQLPMRKAMLSATRYAFAGAIGAGWLKTNPAAELVTEAPTTKRERLTLDTFLKIRAAAQEAGDTILVNAMNLALLTAQRRHDITNFKKSMIEDGHLHVVQTKAKDGDATRASKIRIPLSLTLMAINMTLGTAIANCRDKYVVSPFILHHVKYSGKTKPGHKISDKGIEARFKEAREAAKVGGEFPPTFHEIRSLSARLFKKQGINTKVLLGHKSDSAQALYQDSRGVEWETVEV